MNIIPVRSCKISKRLEVISRRFVFIIAIFVLVNSFGYAADTILSLHQGIVLLPNDFSISNNSDSSKIDSMAVENEPDSNASLIAVIGDSSIIDTSESIEEQEEIEPKWTIDAGVNYKNQDQKSGVELSAGKPVIGTSFDITHQIGLGLSFGSVYRLENGGAQFQNLSYALNYTYSAAKWLDLEIELTKFHYSSDTANALAAQTGSISLAADFYIDRLIIDLSLDRYLGMDKQTYLSLSGIYLLKYKDLRISPLASVSIVSYQIETKRTKIKQGTSQAVTKRTLSLSAVMASVGFSYPIYSGFSLRFTPAFIYSPLGELSSKRSQVTATLGVSYSVDF